MKTVIATGEPGGSSVTVADQDMPVLEPGTSLVRIHSATINQLSNSIRHGRVPGTTFPLVLGNEASGIIEAGSAFDRGTPVVIYGAGQLGVTQAGLMRQWAVVEDKRLFELPKGLTMEQGAASTVNYITAWKALQRGGVGPGSRVLITGGTGALGHALRELAQQLGADVTISVSSTFKCEQAKALSAGLVLNLSEISIAHFVRGVDAPAFDVVLDTVGGKVLADAVLGLRAGGTAVAIGFAGGVVTALDLVDLIVHEKEFWATTSIWKPMSRPLTRSLMWLRSWPVDMSGRSLTAHMP